MKRTALEEEKVINVIEHFKEDMGGKGFFLGGEMVCEDRYSVSVHIEKKVSECPCAKITLKFNEKDVEYSCPENLSNPEGFTNIRNLVGGARILTELQRWGDDHGKFVSRQDSQGIYECPHIHEWVDFGSRGNKTRPFGKVERFYKIHSKIYE